VTQPLSALEAEQRLLSLELFGMRFGLDRMRRLMTALDHPEQAFRSVHVVGTNGKSSTVRMLAAVLTRHGHRTGAYLSPHLSSFCERIRVDDADISPDRFAAAIERALRAAERVNRGADEGDVVTQFELLTAAAYSELAARGVEFAVVEAGLGGRYDATNVISSEVQVLTNVGLDHTRWLGSRIADIAREKLDVVEPGAALVLGSGMHPEAEAVAEQVAADRGAAIIRAAADPGVPVGALGAFQRRNFAVACAAAEALLGTLDPAAVAAAAAEVRIPGRMQLTGERPLTVLDGAHNPDGIAALVEALPEIVDGRRLVGVVSILDDKDAATMLAGLAGGRVSFEALVLTAGRNPRSLSPAELGAVAAGLGASSTAVVETIAEPHEALRRGRALAGEDGVVVATGSLYLVADLLSPADRMSGPPTRRASML
jgi:dihydrofolate synthase/folylpolyglutamate synthase